MRILKVADVPAGVLGGMNRFMTQSGHSLSRRGHEVDYLFREDLGAVRLAGWGRRLVAPWLVLYRMLHTVHRTYDVVEIHEPVAAVYAVATKLLPDGWLPPCVVVSYGAEQRCWRAQLSRWQVLGVRPPLKSRLSVPLTLIWQSRWAFRTAAAVMVPNDADRGYLVTELGVPPRRVVRVNTGVGEAFFRIRREAGEGLRVMFLGSWIDRKGVREIAVAWSQTYSPAQLRVLSLVGTGVPEEQVLQAFPTGVRGAVRARASVAETEVLDELARHDVFVLPSWCEGMPLATLEAAAAGLACVVSDIPGHAELFPGGEEDGAVLIPPHDPGALSAEILRLARSPKVVRALGQRAQERARALTWDATAQQALDAYRVATQRA